MRIHLPFLALAFFGCSTEDSKDSSATCDVTIKTQSPAKDSSSGYYRGYVSATLSDKDDSASLTIDGVDGAQSTSEDGKTVYFTPNAPLSPDTSYTATLSYCGGDASWDFKTSELGKPLSSDLVGQTYLLDLAAANITEPPGVGALLGQFLTVGILTGVQSEGGGKIQMVGALQAEGSNPPTQEYCDPSIPFPEADFSESPYFEISGSEVTIAVAGYSVVIQDLVIGGTFAPDGSYYGGGVLQGTIDTRAFDSLISDDAEEGAVCDTAKGLGIVCEACPGSGDPYCLSIAADSITALAVDGVTLVEIEGNNCMGCVDGVPADTTETCPEDPNAP